MGALELLAVGALCITSFTVGAKVGQSVAKGEKVELPTVNPLKLYKENEAKRQAEEAQSKIDTIMRNIESYDGTSNGQKDVPGG